MVKYFKTINTKLNSNQNLKLMGCNHGDNSTSSDFFWRKKFYEEQIENCEILILEQPVQDEFYNNFFLSEIGNLAKKYNKPIYIIDPCNETVERYQEKMYRICQLNGTLSKSIEEGYTLSLSMKEHKKKNTHFNLIKYFNEISNSWWKMSHGTIDWRNVRIAKGLEETISQLNFTKILAIHGAGHTRPIDFYLKNPKLREAKNKKYSKFNLLGIKGIRKYTSTQKPSNTNQQWTCGAIL